MLFVQRHTPVLQAAARQGIVIPTLCYHEALKPYGSCRLCLVEAHRNGRPRLVTSCNYPAEDGLVVFTDTERVKSARKTALELLLARCPNVPQIQRLAQKMGIKTSRFYKKQDERCILCGLCVRACEEMVGAGAIGFAGRGIEKHVNTPFGLQSDACIGCGSCTYICPTGCIEMVGEPGPSAHRKIRISDPDLPPCGQEHRCETCTTNQQFIEEMKEVIRKVRQVP